MIATLHGARAGRSDSVGGHANSEPVEAAIEGVTLAVAFGSHVALTGVSFVARAGEVVGVLGPNGSGKTTLIECLTCQRSPQSGQVRLFGALREELSRDDRARLGVVLQESRTDSELSVREHLSMVGGYFGVGREAVARALQQIDLVEQADRRIHKLSGGQRRKVELAAALIGEPDLVFLDEPTTGLDIETRTALWQLIRDARDRGAAVVLTTHYLEEAEALADRIYILADGHLACEGSVAEIASLAQRVSSADSPLSFTDAYRAVVADARGIESDHRMCA